MRIHTSGCKCLCACPCPANSTDQQLSTTTRRSFTTNRSTTSSLYEEAMATDRWPPEPDTPQRPSNAESNNKYPCSEQIHHDIQNVKEDLRMMKVTMQDEMSITRQTIFGQINMKFEEIKYILADIHSTHIATHNDNKNDTDTIKNIMRYEFNRIHTVLSSFNQIIYTMTGTNVSGN